MPESENATAAASMAPENMIAEKNASSRAKPNPLGLPSAPAESTSDAKQRRSAAATRAVRCFAKSMAPEATSAAPTPMRTPEKIAKKDDVTPAERAFEKSAACSSWPEAIRPTASPMSARSVPTPKSADWNFSVIGMHYKSYASLLILASEFILRPDMAQTENADSLSREQNRKMASAINGDGDGSKLPRQEQKRSMDASIADGMAYSVMTGLGDAYIPAAAVLLGASNFYVGLLSALPQFAGAVLQFFSLSMLRIFRNRKVLVVLGALMHAACWLCVAAVMLWPGPLSIPLITLFFSLGAGFSLLINPAWSSWISDIVPENERADFFAKRNRLMQFVLFAATFLAGLALEQMQLSYPVALGFAAVFAGAFAARAASALYLSRMANVPYELQLMREIQMKHLFLLPAHRNELWFLAFIALMNFASLFASPFFTPYLLNNLGYDIWALGVLTAITVLAKVVSYPYWGKIIDRFGNRAVLVTGAFMVPLVPFMWLFSSDFAMLAFFNVFSGFVWSGFDLATFNYALALVDRNLRPSFISKYNIFNGVLSAAGAVAGGLFLALFGTAAIFGYSGILLVFLISTAMRLAVAVIFTPKLAGGREVKNTTQDRAMIFDMVAVYPTQGAVSHVLGGFNFTRKAVAATTNRGGRILKTGLGATGELLAEGGRKLMSKVSRRKRL